MNFQFHKMSLINIIRASGRGHHYTCPQKERLFLAAGRTTEVIHFGSNSGEEDKERYGIQMNIINLEAR